jgi:hypothetical protein
MPLLQGENEVFPGDYTTLRHGRSSSRTAQRRDRQEAFVPRKNARSMSLARILMIVVAWAALASLALVAPSLPQVEAQGIKVGVVDFYAPTPLGAFSGVFPERSAADDLSSLLARAPAGRLEVISRETMQRAEGAMRWQEIDVLHFDRLRALARAVAADRLVLGWIPLLQVEAGGGGSVPVPDDGSGPPTALVNLVVQVFDETQARIVAETRGSAEITMGLSRSQLCVQVLHTALDRAQPDVLRMLTAQAP